MRADWILSVPRTLAARSADLWRAATARSSQHGEAAIAAQARISAPVVWLLGKVQSGKSSIVRTLTGAGEAEIGQGFKACTRTARIFEFPASAPVIRFLDTRGLGETHYDPAEDIAFSAAQAHLMLVVMKALDPGQDAVIEVVRAVAAARDWPIAVAQTGLHEGYPHGQGHRMPYPFDHEGRPQDRSLVPPDLVRALDHQRALFEDVPSAAPIVFVPIDFTRAADGYPPFDYGLEALLAALGRVAPAGLAVALREMQEPALDALRRRAHSHVLGYAMAAAAADIVPVAGLVAVPGVQAKMLHALAELYGVTWDRRALAQFAGALGAGTLVRSLSAFGMRELLKLVPVYGQTIGAVGAAVTSFVTTFALGKAAAYFLQRRAAGSSDAAGVLEAYRTALGEALQVARERKVGEGTSGTTA